MYGMVEVSSGCMRELNAKPKMTLRGKTALVTGAAISRAMAGDVLARFGRIDIYVAKSGGADCGHGLFGVQDGDDRSDLFDRP